MLKSKGVGMAHEITSLTIQMTTMEQAMRLTQNTFKNLFYSQYLTDGAFREV